MLIPTAIFNKYLTEKLEVSPSKKIFYLFLALVSGRAIIDGFQQGVIENIGAATGTVYREDTPKLFYFNLLVYILTGMGCIVLFLFG